MARPLEYTRGAIGMHWVVAGLIFLAFPLGLYMTGLPLSPDKLRYYSYHKWIGITVLFLAVWRVAARLMRTYPGVPDTLPAWERRLAFVMHCLLYGLGCAVPLSGWLMSSAQGFQTVWFGVLPLPDLIGQDKIWAADLKSVHESLSYLMLVLVTGHLLAALWHHFGVRDGVLTRMIPWLR